jgi:hypothetical protein
MKKVTYTIFVQEIMRLSLKKTPLHEMLNICPSRDIKSVSELHGQNCRNRKDAYTRIRSVNLKLNYTFLLLLKLAVKCIRGICYMKIL